MVKYNYSIAMKYLKWNIYVRYEMDENVVYDKYMKINCYGKFGNK